jgi:hypothetical protein
MELNKPIELVHGKAGLTNQSSEGPFSQFFVVWNGEAPVR